MAHRLTELQAKNIMPDYTAKLLASFESGKTIENLEKRKKSEFKSGTQPLVEPLSQRELEVLDLIAQRLSNQEICDKLFLAMSTVKGHNRNIFGKLQVKKRREAVARARELKLIQ